MNMEDQTRIFYLAPSFIGSTVTLLCPLNANNACQEIQMRGIPYVLEDT